MENTDLSARKGESADQFKARISETQREIAREQKAAEKAAHATPPIPASTNPAPVAQVTPASMPEVKPQIPASGKLTTGNSEVDEWLGKKGFKSTEDVATSLRELEREFHRKAQEQRSSAVPGVQPPAQPTVPVPQPWNQPPMYPPGYMPPPVHQPVNVEQLARQYNLDPQDFEKVAAVASDMAESIVQKRLGTAINPLMQRVGSIDREVSRNSEMVSLMSDPVFKNPQVQFEMHRVLDEDPNIFAKTPSPYRYAFDQALMRVARNNLGGSNSQVVNPDPNPANPASRPPAVAGGNGAGGGGAPNALTPQEVSPDIFAKMSLKEKAAHLQVMGARVG